MTFLDYDEKTLVRMANVETLLALSRVYGHRDGPPAWVRCSVFGTSKISAQQISVTRALGEDCNSLWARVLSAIRELKMRRGLYATVIVQCMQDTPPVNAVEWDRRFNRMETHFHRAHHHPSSLKKVRALAKLSRILKKGPRPCDPSVLH